MWPSRDKYLSIIVGAVVNVGTSILDASQILDFKGILRDIEKYGYLIEKPLSAKKVSREKTGEEEIEDEAKAFEKLEKEILNDISTTNPIQNPRLRIRPSNYNHI